MWLCVYECHLGSEQGLIVCLQSCKTEVLLKFKLLVGLPVVVLGSVWLTVCTTCFIVLSMISPWSLSKSEFDCGKIVLTDAGVLCFIDDGRQIPLFFKFWTVLCTHIGPGSGCLMEGVCNSSLTLLPLSSLTFNDKGSGSFAFNCFNPWLLDCSILPFRFYIRLLRVMNLIHVFF